MSTSERKQVSIERKYQQTMTSRLCENVYTWRKKMFWVTDASDLEVCGHTQVSVSPFYMALLPSSNVIAVQHKFLESWHYLEEKKDTPPKKCSEVCSQLKGNVNVKCKFS